MAKRLDHHRIIDEYLHRPDLSVQQIAARNGCTSHTVSKIVRQAGVAQRSRSLPKATRAAIIVDIEAFPAMSSGEIGRRHEVSRDQVRGVRRSIGAEKPRPEPMVSDDEIAAWYVERRDLTIDEIAAALGISRDQVKRVANDRGLSRPRGGRTRVDHDAVAHDFEHSPQMTVAAIAEAHGCSLGTVQRIVRQRDLPPRGHRRGGSPRRLDHDAIAEAFEKRADLTIAEIAELFGCSAPRVASIGQQRGLARPQEALRSIDYGPITAMYRDRPDLSIADIAECCGVSIKTVRSAARNAGLSRSEVKRALADVIVADYVAGDMSVAAIALACGTSVGHIHDVINRRGIPKRSA